MPVRRHSTSFPGSSTQLRRSSPLPPDSLGDVGSRRHFFQRRSRDHSRLRRIREALAWACAGHLDPPVHVPSRFVVCRPWPWLLTEARQVADSSDSRRTPWGSSAAAGHSTGARNRSAGSERSSGERSAHSGRKPCARARSAGHADAYRLAL